MKYGMSLIVRGDVAGPDTFARMAEKAEAIGLDTLWTREHTTVDGPHYRFEEAETGPKPLQRPHLPIYVGGNSRPALRRVARFGDARQPFEITPAGLAELRPALAAALGAESRRAEGFPIAPKVALTFQDGGAGAGQAPTEGRPRDVVDALRRFRDAGATEMCFDIMTETLPVALDTLERFAEEVRPRV